MPTGRDHARATAAAATLIAYSLATNSRHARQDRYVVRNLASATLLIGAARRRGFTWHALGLGAQHLLRALALGLSASAVVLVGVRVATAPIGRTATGRHLLGDRRAALGRRDLRGQVMVRIPVGTAAFEEIAFRGVLHAVIADSHGHRTALIGSSVAFGLWHIGPTLAALRANDATAGRFVACASAVVATGAAGAALAALRSAGGHVAAPWLVHWVANGAALAAAASWQRATGSCGA